MKECIDCEIKGYSPQLCMVHSRHCLKNKGRKSRSIPEPVKIGARTMAWAGLSIATVLLGSAAVSLVGGTSLLHALLGKLTAGAGLTGGGIGLYKSLTGKKDQSDTKP